MSFDCYSGLSSIPFLSQGKTRSISAENPTGEKGSGGKASSNLGIARKGRPCISLTSGTETTIAQIQGPGKIQHIWFTMPDKTDKIGFVLRDLIIRIYWDNEDNPSVESPIGDFFCNGFGLRANVNSLPVSVNPTGGFNMFLPMPFSKSAKITVENQHACEIGGFFYQIDYELMDCLDTNLGYFHAQWRRESFSTRGKDYTILDNVEGQGHYIGTYLAWASLERNWWGEGEIKFFLDGDMDWPTICGTGTEDYFGGAWCFANSKLNVPETYSTPLLGYRFYSESSEINAWFGHNVPMHGMYRWHLPDPIRFQENLRVTIQQIGHNGKDLFERADDISSVAYWYQTEPHAAFPKLLNPYERWPR